MKSILTALILSMTSAVAIAQSPVQRQVPAKMKTQSTAQAVSSVGALSGRAGGGAAAASYAATGRVSAPAAAQLNTMFPFSTAIVSRCLLSLYTK